MSPSHDSRPPAADGSSLGAFLGTGEGARDHLTLLSGTAQNIVGLVVFVVGTFVANVLVSRAFGGGTAGATALGVVTLGTQFAFIAAAGTRFGMDMAAVRRRKRAMVDSFRSGGERRIQATAGLDLLLGEARFIGPNGVEVPSAGGTRALSAPLIFINTGGRPTRPALPGIDSVPALDSTSIMELGELPEHLLVLGGGYIGLEFGQMFRRFGSRVTVVQRASQLAPREDADVSEEIRRILCEDGVEVVLNTKAASVERTSDGGLRLTVQNGGTEHALLGSHILLATGRRYRQERLHHGERAARDQRAGRLRPRRREGRTGVHPHLLR